jgi:hypothetical protein
MPAKAMILRSNDLQEAIHSIRSQKVLLDRDLAALYGATTGNLNKAVRRNIHRFPHDLMFELSREEADSLRFQIGILKRGQHFKYLPRAFTEQICARRPRLITQMGKHRGVDELDLCAAF